MRYVFALIAGFIALGLYLEQQPSSVNAVASKIQQQPIQRAAEIAVATEKPALKAEQRPTQVAKRTAKSLNLELPHQVVDSAQLHFPSQHPWQNTGRSDRERIRYEAELVYDLEKGEDITGGKVSILIPFG
jgi:hypothetical protein